MKRPFDPLIDASFYGNVETGETLVPVWTHIDCGGEISMCTKENDYQCRGCKQTGSLGVDIPPHIRTRRDQLAYALDEATEAILFPRDEEEHERST